MMGDLLTEIDALCKLNEQRVRQMRQAGVNRAESEAAYRRALRVALLEERVKKIPMTIIEDVCRGRDDIAELKLRRDCAEADYKAFAEEINTNKLRIRVLNEQLEREWSAAGGGGFQ